MRRALPAREFQEPEFAHSHRRVLVFLDGAIPRPGRWRGHFQHPVRGLALIGNPVGGHRFLAESERHQQIRPQPDLRLAILMDQQQVVGNEDIRTLLDSPIEVIQGVPGMVDRAPVGRRLQQDQALREPIVAGPLAKPSDRQVLCVHARAQDEPTPPFVSVAMLRKQDRIAAPPGCTGCLAVVASASP